MQIKLSDHFSYRKLLRFTLPSIIMMVISSIYSVVDGLFVSNLVGDLALSSVNIVFPVAMIVGSFGFMLGTGGSAIVARTMGEGDQEQANRYFSMIILAVVLLGVVLSIICVIFMEPIARLAGASDALIDDCIVYGRILLAGSVPFMLQTSFQSFFVVAEKPQMGLILSIAAGVTNMVLDYVLIAICGLGVAGAAIATVIGYCVGGVLPLLYFLNPCLLYTSCRCPARCAARRPTAPRAWPAPRPKACLSLIHIFAVHMDIRTHAGQFFGITVTAVRYAAADDDRALPCGRHEHRH